MKFEAKEKYPRLLWVTIAPDDYNITQLQIHISSMTYKIQELTISRASHPQVWCTRCYTKGNTMTKYPILRGVGTPPQPMVPALVGPSGEVSQVIVVVPFHGLVQYHAFPNHQGNHNNEYCEICRSNEHSLRHCPILQKYTHVPNIVYYELCGSPNHTTKQCHTLDALANNMNRFSFTVDEASQGFGVGRRTGGGFRGGRNDRRG